MWKLQAVAVQILLLGSLLSTYFQPTLVPGLVPQKSMQDLGLEPPASRLAVFLVDGLSAEVFLEANGKNVPDLWSLYMEQGRIAISQSTPPTMTRSGHVAIFGGLTEDPSTILVNYRYIPTPFDTVFNRSRMTYGWVLPNVNRYFKKLPHNGAPLQFHVFKERSVGRLNWDALVYKKFREFISQHDNVEMLRSATSPVLFFYLADVDIAGHRYTTTSPEFFNKLLHTQRVIRGIYELIEAAFNDNRTAYLMTSDHGQTALGYHGLGSKLEVETPLFLWGAGVSNQRGEGWPIVRQVQLAPLMSSLIGLPPPMNNLGVLPMDFLNASAEYKAKAQHLNTLQILDQAKVLLRRHMNTIFHEWVPQFEELGLEQIDNYTIKIAALYEKKNFDTAKIFSRKVAILGKQCIEYYTDYYQFPLLVATTVSCAIWCSCLLLQLTRLSMEKKDPREGYLTWPSLIPILLGILIISLIFLQNVPIITGFYLLMPVGLFIMALAERGETGQLIKVPIVNFALILLPAGLFILMFFTHRHIAFLYFVVVCTHNRRAFGNPSPRFFVWLTLVIIVSISLFLAQNPNYAITYNIMIDKKFKVYISLLTAMLRPIMLGHEHFARIWAINAVTLCSAAFGVSQFENNIPVSDYVKMISWLFLAYAFLSMRYFDKNLMTSKSRMELITFNMITLLCLFNNDLGPLMIQIIITELILGLELYERSKPEQPKCHDSQEYLKQSYRYAFAILLYFYASFVVSGHWISSFLFKPIVARLFYSKFSIGISGTLVILKIALPALIVITTLSALVPFVRYNKRSIISCMFLISNVISLYLCYSVGKRGSRRHVRTNLDHLLVSHLVVLIVLACSGVATMFLGDASMEKAPAKDEKSSSRENSTDGNLSA
ncbi:hypothetical protein KR018_011522 [Drosophila ironensis]|nr:hypothetical protein KR018_011522 [Drosophila ironensis]